MAEPMNFSEDATPHYTSDRDIANFSDHITVWIDKYIGVEDTYPDLKKKFDNNIQVLKSNNQKEDGMTDDSMLLVDPVMLKKLSDQVYCLKYFSDIDKAVEFIKSKPAQRIFFISSGSIGKDVVPRIYNLPQIHGIYIFCGHISAHTGWAAEYVDHISAILEHQDNLLQRLTRDIGEYVEDKGDRHPRDKSILQAKNCYTWAKKLYTRAKELEGTGLTKLIDRVDGKLQQAQSTTEAPSQ